MLHVAGEHRDARHGGEHGGEHDRVGQAIRDRGRDVWRRSCESGDDESADDGGEAEYGGGRAQCAQFDPFAGDGGPQGDGAAGALRVLGQ